MSTRYLLLTPLTTRLLNMPLDRIVEVAIDAGLRTEHSLSLDGQTNIYVTADSPEQLAAFCDSNNLNGMAIEYTAVFTMSIEIS